MKFLFTFLLASTTLFCYSQYVIVSGKVMNAETNAPMPGASVFAENTTLGTSTDADGNFKLYLPPGGYDIIATYTGFNSSSKRITTNENDPMSFSLRVHEKQMMDIAVVSSSEVKDGWVKYGDFFLAEFIGKSENSSNCTIKNKEAIHFYFSKRKNRLKVTSEEPVLIENKSLGYIIKYNLDSFTHEYNTNISWFTGSPLFEEIPATDTVQMQQWTEARKKAYDGSILHFMRSVYNKKLKENGFEIQFIVKDNDNDRALKLKNYYAALNYSYDESTQTVEIKPNQTELGVIYIKEKPSAEFLATRENEPDAFQFSVLSFLPKESLIIERNGYYYEQTDITISAYWTWEKVAELLPYNYMLNEENNPEIILPVSTQPVAN